MKTHSFFIGLAGFLSGLFFLSASADMATIIGQVTKSSPLYGYPHGTWPRVLFLAGLGAFGCLAGIYIVLQSVRQSVRQTTAQRIAADWKNLTIGQAEEYLQKSKIGYVLEDHSGEWYEPYVIRFADGSRLMISNWEETNTVGRYEAIQ